MFTTQSLRKAKGKLYAGTMYHSVEGKQCYPDDTEGTWAWERKVVLTPISQVGAQVNPCFSREYSTLMICPKKYAGVKIRVSVKERHVDLD